MPRPDDGNLVAGPATEHLPPEIPRPALLNSCFACFNSELFCKLLGDGVAASWRLFGDLI